MAQYLPLPDGNSLLMKEGETPQEAWARAQRQFPDSFKSKEREAQPEGGFVAATKAGLASLKGDVAALAGRSGLMDEAAAEKYIKEQEEYKKRTFKPTEEGWTQAPITKTAELLGGSLPYMVAPIAAGAVAPAGLASLGAVGAASALQFTGSNLSRQMDEGKKLGETELGYAAAAAIPQAALDVISLKMLPGIRSIFAAAGKQVPEKALLEATKQSTAQIAKDYALATGKAMSTEGLTEAGQQVFERLQAGLNITDEKARDEYFDSFIGGVVLGGVLAPGGRYLERRSEAAKKQVPEQEEMKRLREEEEQRIAAEKQRKATPEYAQEVVQKYDELAKQRQDLVAQLKKVKKDSPTFDADKAFNAQINAQIRELNKDIAPLSEDYYKSKAMLGQMAEKERVAKLTPQEYAFGLEPETEEQKAAREPELYEQQIATPPKPAAPLTPRQQVAEYADQRIALANDQLNTAATYSPKYKAEAIKDYTDYLMQDFTKAQQLVQTRPTLAGLPTDKEGKPLLRSEDIFNALKLRIGSEAKTATKQRAEEQLFDQQKLTQPKDQMALYKASEEQVEEQKKTAEPNFDYLDPMFEKALSGQSAVKVNENLRPLREAPTVRKTVDQLFDTIEEADRDYRAFKRQGNKDAAMDAFQKLNTANDQLNAMAKEKPAGVDTKGLKRGPAEEDTRASYARELINARRAQQEAMAVLEDATSDIRSQLTLGKETEQVRNPKTGEMETRLVGFGKGVASSSEASLVKKAEEARAAYIQAALQEAAINRRALNKPALTTDEALVAASKLHDTINNWIERSKEKGAAPVYEDVIVQPAQMRADKIVRAAVTERRLVSGGVRKLSEAEIKHFRAIIKDAKNKLTDEAPRKVQKLEAEPLNVQYAATEAKKTAEARGETATTLGGELRRRTEFVRNKMSKMGGMRPAARDALNAAADLMDSGKATRDLLDKVEPVVDAIVAGRDVKQVDIQAIKDAIRATEEVPQGQKSLFPEIQEDLGYIRATPKNFANSPRIRPVWETLAKSRELFKKSEQARAARKATVAKRLQFLERVKERGESIIADTQYFWKDTSRWTDEQLAKVFVGMPEAGTTQEEKAILEKYRTLQPMSEQERQIAERLVREFKTEHLPKYKKQIDEAMRMLADGRRLDDTDNQLLAFMQDTNEKVRAAAKALNDRLQPLRTAIKQVKKAMQGSVVISAEQKAVLDSEKAIKQQRVKYQQAVELAISKAQGEMNNALAFLLDPVISKTSADLEKAKTTLDKEQAELDKIKKRFDDVLAQKEGANRTELATYELFRYEEKKDVVDDLKKQVEEQETALQDLVEERAIDYDGGYAVAQAMLDSNVKFERQYLEMLEANLASMRGESVLDKQSSYPFAYQQAKKNADAQRATLKAAEKRATNFGEVAKSDQQKLEDIWKTTFGGEGVKREEGKVERIQTTAEKEAEQLRIKAMEALEREEDAFARTARKEQIIKTYGDQIADLLFEAEGIPGPNTEAELKKIINDPKSELQDVINAQAKVGVLRAITSVEAQMDVFLEGKPKRKQSAATTLSSSGQARGKPLRAGRLSEKSIERLFKPEPAKTIVDRFDFGAIDREEVDIGRASEGRTQGSFDFGGDFNFSRGEPVKGTTASKLKEELDEAMGTDVTARGNVKIYSSVDAFIKENPKYAGKIPSDAKGFAENERAVLFANNIGKGHGLGVLLHEIGVHVGFRNFFNKAQFNRLADTVKGWAKRTDGSVEAQIGRKAMQRVEAAKTPAKQVNDELLAYAVEEAVQAGVLGTKKGSAYGWLSAIIDAFKKALNKLGIPTSEITAGDLVNFAHGCAQLELRGTWHGTSGVFDMFDFAFMGTGEGAQAFSWGTYRAQKKGVAASYKDVGKEKRLREWNALPEIIEWKKSSEPTFEGYSVDDFIEFAQNPRNKNKELAGIPHKYALDFSMLMSFTDISKHDYVLFDPYNDSPAQRWSDALARFDNGMDEGLLPLEDDAKQFLTNVDLGKFKTPYKDPTFHGYDWGDLRTTLIKDEKNKTPEFLAAENVLWAIKQNTSTDTFEKKLDDALNSVKEDAEADVRIFKDSRQLEHYKDAKIVLEGLKAVTKNDFVFNPKKPPPIPEPTTGGVLMRTIHTRPEDTYLLWDSSLNKQPEPVNEALKNVLRDMRPDARRQFDRIMNNMGDDTGAGFYEALKLVAQSKRLASEILASYGISGNKFLDHSSRYKPVTKKSTYNYVDYMDREEGAEIVAVDIEPIGKAKGILLSRNAEYANPEFDNVRNTMRTVVAQNRTWWDTIKANTSGLAFATQLVDRFAGFERLAKYMEPLKGTQMLYYLKTYDQRMNLVSKAVSDGAPVIKEVTRKDGYIERLVETSGGANIAGVVNKLKEAKPYIGNGEAVNQVFTTYMAAIRAKAKGIETLNFGKDKDGKPVLTQAMLDEVTNLVNNNRALKDIFEDARKEYNQYNRDMLNFVASTGALSKALVKKLIAEDDYIPFYRERKGVIELMIGNENPVRIGSIADQPYLQELVGGDTAILDFMTSSVQNTNMLMDMGLRNLATKNAVMELVDLGAAIVTKKPTDGTNVVQFKVEGDDRYAILSTEKVKIGSKEFETGVPADILVKGMEGIPTQMPFILRAMAMPAQVLRKAVTLSPLYMAKQLFRDSLAAPLLSGADFTPVMGALRELNGTAKQTLEKRGIIGGQQFKGTSEDLSKILRDITEGQSGWMQALGRFEAMGMEADALTRRAQYNSYIEQGLSEMEATLMALESMNFNKRGASPSIHVANALIPFFNAQIQGLNVMYKAMSGNMPFNDQLRIREKMLMRGGMMAAATIIYAMMMQDDEAYQNATPDQKYGNWFIRLPGLDEPVRVPVPFEIGYVFKAIPEALYNSMTKEHGAEEAIQAFNQILINVLPGGSSMPTIDVGKGLKVPTLIPMPQAIKPMVEQALEKSFFTGRDLLSEREKQLLPEQQYRTNTSEAAKLLGSTAGISPIKIEALVNGYTGTMGLAFLQAISLGVPSKETPEQAVKRLSEYPIVGGVFQPNDAGGIINSVYMRMNEIERVKKTVDALVKEGKVQEADALITKRGTEYMQSELANTFKANMNMLTQAERAIAASDMTGEAKRKQLDDIRKMKIGLANATREISDKTIHLVGGS